MYFGSGPTRNGIVYAISVNQKNPTLLNWLKDRFNGGVYQGYGNSRPCGEWRVTGNNAYAFLKAIEPFIIGRRPEVTTCIQAWEKRSDREEFARLASLAKEVKKR